MRNNPLRYVDPAGEKVYVADVTGQDRDDLLKYMNGTYGCLSCVTVTDDGYLAVDTSGLADEILKAAEDLTDAINSTHWFAQVKVSNNDSNVAFGATHPYEGGVQWNGRRRNADLIVLDFADNKQVKGDPLAVEAFMNTVLAHEILHRFPGNLADPQGADAYRIGGPVVAAVNRITSALGLPSRATYSWHSAIPGTEYLRYQAKSPQTGKEQTLLVYWQRSMVGGEK